MSATPEPSPAPDDRKARRRAIVERLVYLATVAAALVAAFRGVEINLPVKPMPVGDGTCRCQPCPPPAQPPDPNVPPRPPAPPAPKPDAPAAIVRIQFGTAGCTATVIGPRREDGRWWVLTAAHCVKQPGQHGTMRLKDGRSTGVVVVAVDPRADACWLVTESNSDAFPFAHLAAKSPEVGSKVWHAGYGFDRPGNTEAGVVQAGADQNGQLRFFLNVSSGDSGGGICLNENNEVVSCVCCTTKIAAPAQVWGACPEAIHRLKPTVMALDDWTPVPIPVRPEVREPVDGPKVDTKDVPEIMPKERPKERPGPQD